MNRDTDIFIKDVQFSYEDHLYRTPLKFGGVPVDRATLLNVECLVVSKNQQVAHGFGSMPLGNVWAFPSKVLSYNETLDAMKALAEKVHRLTKDYSQAGHPLEINHELKADYQRAAQEVTKERQLAEPIPELCMLVVVSAFDAAIHDAFGKMHGLNCYYTYGSDFVSQDLSHFLGEQFKGEYLDQYISKEPQAEMPLYHLIGALDPLTDADVQTRLNDGHPETLPEWIRFNGLTHLKIKLNGDDLDWDVNRILSIEKVTAETQRERNVTAWNYSLDFNERCPNVAYLLELLHKVKEQSSEGFERVQYIEQPTARDLKANRDNVMHEASALRPVVIDESLIDQESLEIAQEMGYTGAALKACKGQSDSLLMAAVAQKMGMFLCVQDLTCPGASLLHSAGLAAHVPGVAAIEANARQYMPSANDPWRARFPGIFNIENGMMKTAVLNGPGLGIVEPKDVH